MGESHIKLRYELKFICGRSRRKQDETSYDCKEGRHYKEWRHEQQKFAVK